MKLNCKPGDFAVIVRVRTLTQNLGALVECVEFVGGPENEWRCKTLSPLQGTFRMCPAGGIGRIRDGSLRPIRDSDGEDETLQWLDVPNKQGVPA
jgi:hypothetical protein